MDEINFEFVKIPKKLIINLEESYEKNKNKIVQDIIKINSVELNNIETNSIVSLKNEKKFNTRD
tara:strand:+ start:1538 stop:1729 length:192 start_codon:yes stop_codon:yes gene_type:complete